MNRWINNTIDFVKARPLGALFVLAFLLALIFGGYRACRSAMYDRGDAKAEAEKKELIRQRDEAVKRGDYWQLRAEVAETENAKTDKLIDEQGGKIEAAKERLDREMEAAKRDAGVCATLPDAAAQRECVVAKLRAP